MPARPFTGSDDLEAKVTADVSRWLAEHSAIADRRHGSIQRSLALLLQPQRPASALGKRSYRGWTSDAHDNVFMTGDVYQTIVQHYPALKDYAIDFED